MNLAVKPREAKVKEKKIKTNDIINIKINKKITHKNVNRTPILSNQR